VVVLGAVGLAAVVACLVLVLGGVSAALGSGDPDPPVVYHGDVPNRSLREKLAQPITLDKGIGPSTTLKDTLEFLSETYGVPIIVDSLAFASIGVQKVEEQPVSMPIMRDVPLQTVLRLIVGQVKGDQYVGTFQLNGGRVEITTTYHQFMSTACLLDCGRPNTPIVSIEARGQNLEEAFAYLSESTDINVVVDARVRDRLRRVAAPPLRDVPMDTALRLMTDMADLGVAITDNVFYVTDVENARALNSEREKLISRFRQQVGGPPTG
jgi:hypothetical protein